MNELYVYGERGEVWMNGLDVVCWGEGEKLWL